MEEEVAGRHGAAGPRGERPAVGVDGMQIGMWKVPAVDDDVAGYFDMLAGQRHHGLDERAHAAAACARPHITALYAERECRRSWRAYEDQIANGNRPVHRLDAPEPERIAGCEIETEAGAIGRREHQSRDQGR